MHLPLLILLLTLHGLPLATPASRPPPPPSLTLTLLRRRPPSGAAAHLHHLRSLFHSDQLRHQTLTRALPTCDTTPGVAANSSFALPIRSGAYAGTGEYFVRFRVGTPAQKFLLIADTGSDLTWMNCRHGRRCRTCREGTRGGGRVFEAGASSTFRPIGCSSETCKTLPSSLTTCPTPASPCAYDYGYSDGSTTQGFYANESATVALPGGRKTKLRGLTIGCTSASVGPNFNTSDGVLGLGYSSISFATHATHVYGGRFSYCLVDHLSPRNASSYLTFGPNPALHNPRQTPLLIEKRLEPFYAVGVEGISVSGEVLKIPKSVWDVSRGGGTIIDSGTSLTVLAEPAYKEVVGAISKRLSGVPRVNVDPFEYCYNWTGAGEGVMLPQLVVHFNGSARLEPPAKSYVIDVEPGVKCIGLTSTPWPGLSTIGNILQQEHLWEFDIRKRELRFERSMCEQ